MALLIDRDWVTLGDLTVLDSEVPAISEAEGIVVEGPGGVIREAWTEAANWLETSFPVFGDGWLGAPAGRYAGGMSTNRFRVDQVVASFEYGSRVTPVVDWLRWLTLAAFYRSAVRRTPSDRYAAKLEDALVTAKAKLATLKRGGVPVVASPLPAPGALYADYWGRTEAGEVGADVVSGAVGTARTIYCSATFFDALGAESGPSKVSAVSLNAGELASMSVGALVPIARPRYSQPVGWRLYAGSATGELRKVGGDLALDGWVLLWFATDGSGARLSNGQIPTTVIPHRDLILRGG